MSAIGDALKALKKAILLEERIASQSKKLERLAFNVIEMDKRLAALEGRMEGFLAAAAAFAAGAEPRGKPSVAVQDGQPSPPLPET